MNSDNEEENNDTNCFPVLINIGYGGFNLSKEAKELYANKKQDPSYKIEKYSHHTSEREDPILIQIYHELKEKINGKYSNIEITLVNNKYKDCYNIEDYDGN